MATGAQTWSTTAASNNSIDTSVNWAEGQAPSSVNNSARAEMASMAMHISDNSGTLLTSGSTAAFNVTSKQISTTVVDGYTIAVRFHAANDASATLNVDGIGAKQMHLVAGTALSGGEFLTGSIQRFTYTSASTSWVANNYRPASISSLLAADGTVGAPSFSFTNDTDSGLYRIGANDIGFAVGGGKVTEYTTAGVSVTGTQTVSGKLTASSSAEFTNAVLMSGAATVAGAATLQSSLTVTGAALFSGTATINGAATLGSSLTVSAGTLLSGVLSVAQGATFQSSTTLTGAALFSGATTFNNTATMNSSLVAGAASFSGKVTATSSMEVSNTTLFSSDVNIVGGATITSTLNAATIAGAVVATQANQETGSATNLVVTPGRQQYHPSAAKFWVSASGNSTAILSSYNVSSLTDGTASVTVNIATDFSNANWMPLASYKILAQLMAIYISDVTAGTVTVNAAHTSDGILYDVAGWYVAGFGDQ